MQYCANPELNLREMPSAFYRARDEVIRILKGYGITDRIDASLKQFTGNERCWLAMYIRESQFKGYPKFYVNTQTPGIIDAAVLPQSMTVEDVFIDSLTTSTAVVEEFAGWEIILRWPI